MNHRKYMAQIGSKGGRIRFSKLSKEQRHEVAIHAAFSISKEQRIVNAKKANLASQAARKAKKQVVDN